MTVTIAGNPRHSIRPRFWVEMRTVSGAGLDDGCEEVRAMLAMTATAKSLGVAHRPLGQLGGNL